jgi:hypothetical protein
VVVRVVVRLRVALRVCVVVIRWMWRCHVVVVCLRVVGLVCRLRLVIGVLIVLVVRRVIGVIVRSRLRVVV